MHSSLLAAFSPPRRRRPRPRPTTLSELGRGEALFRRIQDDPSEPEILRIWAAAGRIQLADADGLEELEPLVRTWPALERPLERRRAELGVGS